MEFPDLQRDHATFTVREDTEGEDGLHAKGRRRLETLALPDEERIVHSVVRSVGLHRFAGIDGDAHNFKPISSMFAL
jgi:hypothetical protein